MYHITSRILIPQIFSQGLKPPSMSGVKPFIERSDPQCVYFFGNVSAAKGMMCVFEKVLPNDDPRRNSEILEIDVSGLKLERDPLVISGSWRYRGIVPPERIRKRKICGTIFYRVVQFFKKGQ